MLDPYELKIKVQVYLMNTYQLVASAMYLEKDLRRELAVDHQSHLMEGHRREELARYLIMNSQLDESQQLMFFYKSDSTPSHR